MGIEDRRDEELRLLIEELQRLRRRTPVGQAAVCPRMIDRCKEVLSDVRGYAMIAATTGPKRLTQRELAAKLNIAETRVSDQIARVERREAGRRRRAGQRRG